MVAHVQIAADEAALDVVRIPLGTADLMLAADLAVGCSGGRAGAQRAHAVVIGNLDLAATAEFKRNAALSIDARNAPPDHRESHRRAAAPSGCTASGWRNGCSATPRR